MMRYRVASSVPGRKRPCEIELLDEEVEDRGVLRPVDFRAPMGAGVEVAVARGSDFEDCAEPHDGQKRAPDWISEPHDEQ